MKEGLLAGRSRLSWGIVVSAVVLVICLRVVISGSSALEEGEAAVSSGDELGATVLLRESLSWYMPLASWREPAAEALWSLYERQASRGDLEAAVRTLSAIRSGVISGQGLFRHDGELLERVHDVLPGLMARWEASAAKQDGRDEPGLLADREAYFARLLAREVRPDRGWGLLAVLGFAVWMGAAFVAAGRGAGERLRPLIASAVGLALFLIGVGYA